MRWKSLFAVLLGLLMVGMTTGSASAVTIDSALPSEKTIQNDKLAITILEYNNHRMILERETKGISELRFEALYRFASENGVDIRKFMDYLSEYSWNTMRPLKYEDVKRLLLEFSKDEGISLERIAIKKGVNLNFPNAKEIEKVLPQISYKSNEKMLLLTSTNAVDHIYDYYGNSITNQIRDPVTFYFHSGHFVMLLHG